MRTLVINLDQHAERLAFQALQLQRYGLTLERLAAVTRDDPGVQTPADYWDSWQRPLSLSERACLLSHRRAWEIVHATQAPCLILEDDAVLAPDVADLLVALARLTHVDHVTLEARQRKKVMGQSSQPLSANRVLRRLYLDRTGAAAYVLWPSGARKLLALADQHCGLADGLICECPELLSHQVEPAAAFQLDQCAALGLMPPVHTTSSITPSQHERPARHWRHRWRRLRAQWRMGWRQLKHWPRARRRHVQILPETFALPPS